MDQESQSSHVIDYATVLRLLVDDSRRCTRRVAHLLVIQEIQVARAIDNAVPEVPGIFRTGPETEPMKAVYETTGGGVGRFL